MRKVLLILSMITLTVSGYAQLTLNNTPTAAQLVQNYLLGSGVNATNITFTGANLQKGSFTCAGACNLGISSGILLSTGEATAPTSPAIYHHSTDMGTAGDPQLDAIVSPLLSQDAAVLEFDFSVASDSVQFRYVFASEEYNDYANTPFNDVFAFFLSGPGIVGTQNIALIPGTTTPVSINNVNNGNSGGVATGPCMNCAYFVDNVGGGSVYFDGFTTVLTAKAAVQPCQTYHIKLAVADVNDGIFDSGVFLEANSFSSLGQINLYANGVAEPNNATVNACNGSSVNLCLNPSTGYSWSSGQSTQCITVNQGNIVANGNYAGTVFNSNNNCFAYTTTIHVQFVTPTAVITPSGPTNLCPGNNVTLSANVGNTYLWNTGATTQSIVVSTAGSYTVTVSNGPNCSATSTPVNVTVGSATAQITGVTSLCNGANTTLSANLGQSYLWSNGSTTQNINVTNAGTYTVTVTQAGGCTATASANVQVNPNPAPAITGTLAICQGNNTSLNAGAGYSSYLWNTGATTQNLSVSANGTYTVTVTSAAGCSGSTSASVVVNPLPVPAISGNLAFCTGANSTLNAGGGYSSYLWNTGATTQTLNVSTAGNYTVTVTNANSCSASTSAIVVVNPLPVPNITGTFAFCQGANTSLNAGAGYSSYQWSNGATTQNITVNNANTFTVTVTNANGCTNSDSQAVTVNPNPVPAITGTLSICQGTNTTLNAGAGYSGYQWSTGAGSATINVNASGNYTVTVTNANGCTGTTSANVVVNPLPAPAITGTLAFCSGGNSNLNAGGGFSSYAWSNGATTQVINVTNAGNYIVTVTNANNCSASTSALVVVNPLPVPNITGSFAFCQGTNTTLNAGAGYSNYLWSNGATTQNITVNNANTFTVTVTNANGCSNSDSQAVTVNPNPVPAITGVTTICQGNNTSLNAGPGYSSYQWSTGAGGASINVNTAGPYTVTVTDANGCTGTTSANVVVNPLPTPAITGTTSFCQGQNSNLNAGAGYTNYLWSNGATTQLLNVTTSGNYIVTVTNNFGCTASTNSQVTVNPLPTPVISGPTALCQGASGTLNAGGGYSSYQWNTGASTQTISVSSAGTYTVTVTSGAGCVNNTSASLIINPLPTPAITGVTTVCQGVLTTLDAGTGYSHYQWSNGVTTQTFTSGNAGPVTVTVTDANGCVASANSSITVNPLPVPVITGLTSFCQGQSSTLDAGSGFTAYLWNTGATTRTINVTNSGNYVVTVTAINTCQGSDNELITAHPNPVPVITGNTSICQGASTTLNAGAGYSSYVWSNGAITQTINVSNALSYTVTVASSFGCQGSSSVSTVVNPLPTPVINGVTSICQGTYTTFDAGAGYSAYLWNNGNTAQTISPSAAGTYTVTVTDVNGCVNNTNINLTVNPLPAPSITGTTSFCQGQNSNLNASGGFVSYLWSNGSTSQVINVTSSGNYIVTVTDNNGCSANTNSQVIVHPNPLPVILGGTGICQGTSTSLDAGIGYSTYLWNTGATTEQLSVNAAGNYTVTVTSNFGCIGSASTSMVINPLPTPVITGITSVCQGTTSTFDAGSGYNNYLWSNGSTAQIIHPGVAGSYTVTVTDGNGCVNNTSLALVVNSLPTPAITGTLAFCIGNNSNLNAGAGFSNYLWNNGSTTQVINVNTSGTYAVTVTDGNGCSGSTSASVIVNPLPTPVITGPSSVCQGTSATWNGGTGYTSYLWSNGATSSSISLNTAGTYSVTVIDVNGCVNSTSSSLVVYDLPTASITGTNAICIGSSTPLNFNFVGTAPFTYSYSNGSSTFNPAPINSNTSTINVNPSATATYQLISISDAHCVGNVSGSALVTVNPLPQPLITGNLTICDGETTELSATPGYSSYTWSNGGAVPSILTGTAGIYNVTVIDVNGCQGISPSVNLVVNEVPVVTFTNDTSLTCAVPNINFTNLSTYPSGSTFSWLFGDGGTSSIENPSHIYNQPGSYNISLVVTSPAGCASSASYPVNITFYPLPVADFVTSPNPTNVFNGKVGFVDRSSYAVKWLWNFDDGASAETQNAEHYFNEVGDYRISLKVWNIAGCEDVHEDIVNINPFYVPNAFTPNGDGVNDVFYYSGYELDVASYKMQIFNRWGQLIFTGMDENDNWKGEALNGNPAPQGTYVYKLQIKTKGGKEHVYTGQVNLIR